MGGYAPVPQPLHVPVELFQVGVKDAHIAFLYERVSWRHLVICEADTCIPLANDARPGMQKRNVRSRGTFPG